LPNVYTTKHDPPIESALVRTIFFGGHEDELRLWKVMDQFSDTGALPSASYGLLMIGVNAMVYHHSSSENEQGQRSVVCSVPGSPLVFVCDAAAIVTKPFGQQSRDYMLMQLKKQGLKPCETCGGAGRVLVEAKAGVPGWMPGMKTCEVCHGEGLIPIDSKTPVAPSPAPKPATPVDSEHLEKVKKLQAESGFGPVECKVALELLSWDFDKALEWLDNQRKGLGGTS
jgi:hypothetical protein